MIGAPDEERGQIVAGACRAEGGRRRRRRRRVKRLQDHVKATIAPYKYPRSVKFIDALPKTADRQDPALPARGRRCAMDCAGRIMSRAARISSSARLETAEGLRQRHRRRRPHGVPRRPDRLERRAEIRKRRFRRAGAAGAGEYRRARRRSRRRAGAHHAADLVRHSTRRNICRGCASWARPTAAVMGKHFPGHDAGPGRARWSRTSARSRSKRPPWCRDSLTHPARAKTLRATNA